jgi:hypothetical protein
LARFLWTQKQDIGPSPRSYSALAYDSVRDVTYLFGGENISPRSTDPYADTWAWDGRFWTQVARFGPSARSRHTMTFDTARGNSVAFGGNSALPETLGDTWVFDGNDWTQVEDMGPLSRCDHAAAYDPVRQRVVLFGGVHRDEVSLLERLNDTWEWDGESWTQVEATGPSPRNGHVMAYDGYRNRVVLFGGLAVGDDGATRYANDTWEWDGELWTQVADTGPSPRRDAAISSNGRAVVILHGGIGDDNMADTWQWVGGNWSKVQEMGPSARLGHGLAYDSHRQKIVLFGGEVAVAGPDHEYFGDTWEAPASPGPGSGGPGPDSLVVNPTIVSLSQGPTPVIEFDTAAANSTRYIVIYLVNSAGQRVQIDEALLPPGQTHAAHQVAKSRLAMGMNQLGLVAPVDAAFSTELGSSFVVFHIVA